MIFTLLGTGCPQVDTRRFGPSQIVRHHGATYLIDCGSGTTQRLMAAGATGADVDAVFLTHLHSDHIVDLFQLIISSWHQGRDRPQYVYGPKGTKRYVKGLLKLWQPEFKQRIAHEKRTSVAALGAEVVEIKAGEIFHAGEMMVTAVVVDHYPVRPAFGFLFETPEARLAISGDTTYCPELIEAARGVDVLVHEVYIHRGPQPSMLVEDPGSRNVQSYHTSSDVVGRVAREADAGVLLLSHFVPTRFDEEELLQQVSADFDGPILIGEDLMNVDVAGRRVLSWGMSLALGKQPQAPKPEAKLRATQKTEAVPRESKTRTRHII
ncbi:MAG: MBL fold metallo-hydrolase [Rhodospirillales bacterium]|mgnify:CR=1 FL=1|jgi:ribonuclease Z|nr:MBL fold metallo-hydrolase [Rhodospirillales bacterium]MDP6588166.1 MBL fold metallo-hydrolase [Alphaproteobacteria bacterium]